MTYLVMARKWRPQTFDEIIGQEHVTATIKNAILSDRIHHAYLFTGTRGVGKTTSARILAKALNCKNGPTAQPCGVCEHCRDITTGHHIDVQEIDGASNRGIDEIRELRDKVRYTPSSGRYKIYIIDEVHMLTSEAFNALLKTLEEPPSHVVFIFATTEVHKIPATILSRCQKFDFRRISQKEIFDRLSEIVEKEGSHIDPEALFIISKKADGSLRDAQSLLDQIISFSTEKVTALDVQRILGVVDQEVYFDLTECIITRDINRGMVIVDNIFSKGYDLHELTLGMLEHLRNLLIIKSKNENANLLNIPPIYVEKYQALCYNFNVTDLLRLIDIALKMEAETKKNVHSRSQLELRIIAMIQMASSIELNQLVNFIQNGPDQTIFQPTSALSERHESESRSTDESNAVSLDQIWALLLNRVTEQRTMLGASLSAGIPTSYEDHTLTVSFDNEHEIHQQILSSDENFDFIRAALSELTDQPLQIVFIVAPPKETDTREQIENQAPQKNKKIQQEESPVSLTSDVLAKNPGLKTVLDLFDGEVII